MRIFTDSTGDKWSIAINVSAVKRVRDETGLDLLDLLKPGSDTIEKLASDVVALFGVLCAVVRPQLAGKLTDDEFGERLDERAAAEAGDALIAGVIDFFRPAKREPLHRAREAMNAATDRATAKAIEEANRAIEATDFDALAASSIHGATSTNSPAPSA